MELIPDIKFYEWGKRGHESEVATLAAANCCDTFVVPDKTYAEWWMGDHVSGPASVKSTGQPLHEAIVNDPGLIGGMPKMPYLLKVLSIQKALSIQVHPNKVSMSNVYI